MPRRGRGDLESSSDGDPPSKKQPKKTPLEEYLDANHARNRDLFGMNTADASIRIRACLQREGLPPRLRVFRHGGDADAAVLVPIDPAIIAERTHTFYHVVVFLSQHVLVVCGETLTPAFDLIMILYARVFASVHGENMYILKMKIDAYEQEMIETAVLMPANVATAIPGNTLATVAYANNTNERIAIEKTGSFLNSVFFLYPAQDPMIWNPISSTGREERRAVLKRRTSDDPVLATGQRPPYSVATMSRFVRMSEGELDAEAEAARARTAWPAFVRHVYGMLAPREYGKDLFAPGKWEKYVEDHNRDAAALIYWIAYVVQTCRATRVIPLLVSVSEQCGKGTLMYILQRMLGSLMWMGSPQSLEGQFHESFIGRIVVALDEVGELFRDTKLTDAVKRYAGATTNEIKRKFLTSVHVPGQLNFVMITNGGAIHVSESNGAMSRPWPFMVTGALNDKAYYDRIYKIFAEIENCLDLYIVLSRMRLTLSPGDSFQPFNNLPVGVCKNRALMMTHLYSTAIRALHGAVVAATTDVILLSDAVEMARNTLSQNSAARSILRDDINYPQMRNILRHLACMGLFHREFDPDQNCTVLVRHVVRDAPVRYLGVTPDDFLARVSVTSPDASSR